jgi:hypothetical protein
MQYGSEPCCSAEFFIVLGEGLEGMLDTVKHQRIDEFLASPGQVPKLPGKGEGNQIVFGREPFVQLIFDPLLIFVVLAMGAVSVTTRVGDIPFFGAVIVAALHQHFGAMLMPALLHVPEGLFVPGQDCILVSLQKAMLELVDNHGKQNHLTPPQVILKVSVKEFTA